MECLCISHRTVCVLLTGSTGLCSAVPSLAAELLSLMLQTLLVINYMSVDSYKTSQYTLSNYVRARRVDSAEFIALHLCSYMFS